MYTGCDYDVETGLTYHWNRWRSEDGSNWLSVDPAHDGLNWYGYAGQNPTNYIDRNGLSTTRDDYAYQLRMQGNTEAADKMERDAAAANQGFSQSFNKTAIEYYIDHREEIAGGVDLPNIPTQDEMTEFANEMRKLMNIKFYDEPIFDEKGNILLFTYSTELTKSYYAEMLGDLTFGLGILNSFCFFTCPAICLTSLVLDGVAMGLYIADGNFEGAAFTVPSILFDAFSVSASSKILSKSLNISPSLIVNYNAKAQRYINGSGRFIKTNIGRTVYGLENIVLPTTLYINGKTSGEE